MEKKVILLVFLALSAIPFASAQYTGDIPAVNPVTPNEAAMFKPVAQPIGSFSGTVPIDIPLFTAGRPSMPVPMSLSYNGSGFKVEEYASSVGLGWNLSVGGSITRVVHGLADDVTGGYITSSGYKPSQILSYYTYTQLEPPMNDDREGGLDLEPDEFYFTCNGLSGKFHFDENGKVQVEEASGITIVPVLDGYQNQISGWTLTDNKGNIYYFGGSAPHTSSTAVDQNSISYSSNNGYTNLPASQIYNIDWHLVEIDDMNGHDLAEFDYSTNENYIETRLEAYMKLQTAGTSECDAGESYDGDETFATSETFESVLTNIYTPVDQITIYGDYNRVDYTGGWRVDSIRQTDLSGNLKKMYHFNYNYFYQPGFPTGEDAYYKRLELLNISEFGATGRDSLSHSFDYNTSYNLPSRMSRGQDYWGFYNGEDYNWTLLPNGSYTAMGETVSEGSLGERRPSFPYSEANMLTKIHFPTGGTRAFTYEANQYLWDPESTATPDASYDQYESLYANSFNLYSNPQYQSNFTIADQSGGTTWNFYIDGCCYYGSYTVQVLDQYGYTVYATFSNQLSGSISLENGTYQVQFTYDVYNCTIYDFNAYWDQLSMNSSTLDRYGRTLDEDNMTGPGVRIREVDDYDPVSGQTISTQYQYNLFSDSTLTSGLLITPTSVLTNMSSSSADCGYYRLTANSNYPLSQQGGSYVNYTDVRTYQTNNGRTDQHFSYDFDNPQGGAYGDFLTMLLDNSWRRGKLLSTRYYDNSGNLLRMDTTAYSIVGDNSSYWAPDPSYYPDTTGSSNFRQTFAVGFNVHAWIDPVYPGLLDYDYYPWVLTSQFMGADSTVSHLYTSNGSQVQKTAYSYYDSLSHPLLRQDQHWLNSSVTELHDYRYAFDSATMFLLGLSSGDRSMKTTLRSLNYFQPLEITTRKQQSSDTSFVEGMHYGFGSFYVYPRTYYYPNLARHYTTLSNYTDMNFVSYDSIGNLAEQYKTGGPHTVWLWGYSYTQPVAKIVGTTYSAATAFVTNATLQHPSSDNDIRTQVNNIRSGLAGAKALVTTYTWTPLFGMTSQVDPGGTITYYDYDNHGRLLDIRDQNNNIVKRFTYTLNNP